MANGTVAEVTNKRGRVSDLLLFWGRWVRDPKQMGAVAPSSGALARAMVSQIPHDHETEGLPVIELGGGTGSITEKLLSQGIKPCRLIVVERDEQLARHLQRRFSGVRIVNGDAGDLPSLMRTCGVERIAAIVSGLPLLLFPRAALDSLVQGSFKLLGPNHPFIQFTYGTQSPLPDRYGLLSRRVKRVWVNVPPATVWTYSIPGNAHASSMLHAEAAAQ